MPIGQEHKAEGTNAARRCPSRTPKAGYPCRGWLDCFRNSCHRQLACPSVFNKSRLLRPALATRPSLQLPHCARLTLSQPCSLARARLLGCGDRNRTCEGAVNSRLPVPAQAPPQSSRRSWIRTNDLLRPRQADGQTVPYAEIKSAQRELNPHFRHGKAAGYRYIMGASNR